MMACTHCHKSFGFIDVAIKLSSTIITTGVYCDDCLDEALETFGRDVVTWNSRLVRVDEC